MVTCSASTDLKTSAASRSAASQQLPPPAPSATTFFRSAAFPTTFDSQIRRHQLASRSRHHKERSRHTRCPLGEHHRASSPTGDLFLLPSRSPHTSRVRQPMRWKMMTNVWDMNIIQTAEKDYYDEDAGKFVDALNKSIKVLSQGEDSRGVKFDPTDLAAEHLEGKVGRAASHVLIDGFIPTIEEAEVICHTHLENLPGVKLDGIASHFFHKISNAYDVGKRKRRKISHSDHIVCDENLRWHKIGKSRSILDNNGVIKGWKKILVLYIGSRKGGGKAEKTNWRMHQYHLGVDQEYDSFAGENDPTTPITYPAQTCRPNGSPSGTEQNQDSLETKPCNTGSHSR
ncbi:hypothetical protein ZWY2020_025680 [Hordeum vulgare]|nr:hypothetical protein ZWY2020_025680 [Hordeum vulgare]